MSFRITYYKGINQLVTETMFPAETDRNVTIEVHIKVTIKSNFLGKTGFVNSSYDL